MVILIGDKFFFSLNESINLNPNYVEAWNNKGNTLRNLK